MVLSYILKPMSVFNSKQKKPRNLQSDNDDTLAVCFWPYNLV